MRSTIRKWPDVATAHISVPMIAVEKSPQWAISGRLSHVDLTPGGGGKAAIRGL